MVGISADYLLILITPKCNQFGERRGLWKQASIFFWSKKNISKIFLKNVLLINTVTLQNEDRCMLIIYNDYLILKHIVRQMYNLALDLMCFILPPGVEESSGQDPGICGLSGKSPGLVQWCHRGNLRTDQWWQCRRTTEERHSWRVKFCRQGMVTQVLSDLKF